MSPGEIAAILTAVAGLSGAIVAGAKMLAGAAKHIPTDYNVLITGYDEIVENLRTEISRIVLDSRQLRAENLELRKRVEGLEIISENADAMGALLEENTKLKVQLKELLYELEGYRKRQA